MPCALSSDLFRGLSLCGCGQCLAVNDGCCHSNPSFLYFFRMRSVPPSLRLLDFFNLHCVQIQRGQTVIHGVGCLDKFRVGRVGGQGVRREAFPCLGLLF